MAPTTLCTVIPAAEVTDELKAEAADWEVWDSSTYPKKFPFDYETEERTLILEGKATLIPKGKGAEPIVISAGDAVTFHAGFSCKWTVEEPMKKYYLIAEPAEETKEDPPPLEFSASGRPLRTKKRTAEVEEEAPAPKKKAAPKKAPAKKEPTPKKAKKAASPKAKKAAPKK